MTFPHVIWTLRRTGGTTLATLLAGLSDHPGVQHEPFNAERIFGEVTRNWTATRDAGRLRDDMQRVLARRPVIKHCVELVPEPVNDALLTVSASLGYVQIVLDRRADVDRILSLELARHTGAWGKAEARRVHEAVQSGERSLPPIDIAAAATHLRACDQRRWGMHARFADHGIAPFVVHFEDIYADPARGRDTVAALTAFIGINRSAVADYDARVEEALLTKGQKSARLLDRVPNIDEARAALEEVRRPSA
jgi:LPS sulfotransferase NodH